MSDTQAEVSADYEVDPSTGCWVWMRYRDRNGYARTYADGKTDWAHRVYYRRYKGPIPPGLDLDHSCCNPPCVNPAHLEAVTKVEHVRRTFMRNGTDQRHLQAALFRVEGLTYSEIAELLGYLGEAGAQGAVVAAIRKGLVDPDELPTVQRMTDADHEDIRLLHHLGVNQPTLARFYNVHDSQISRVVNRQRGKGAPKR